MEAADGYEPSLTQELTYFHNVINGEANCVYQNYAHEMYNTFEET